MIRFLRSKGRSQDSLIRWLWKKRQRGPAKGSGGFQQKSFRKAVIGLLAFLPRRGTIYLLDLFLPAGL
jgi:hypothetical protein